MLRDCWGEWGLWVDTALEHEIFITLRIERNVKDGKTNVKFLGISHKAGILEKICDVPIYFSRLSAILENLRDVPIYPILAQSCTPAR